MDYVPEEWVTVKISTPKETIYKILAGWRGGFASGDSWKLNSGITAIKELDNSYEVSGYSGSIYNCYKHKEHCSSFLSGIFDYLQKKNKHVEVTIVPMQSVIEYLESQKK